MPVIKVDKERLSELLNLKSEEIKEVLFRLKCEVDEVEGQFEIEVNADRIDMLHPLGIKRAVEGLLGRRRGIPHYVVRPGGVTLKVEEVPTRPFIAAAVIKNFPLDDEGLKELIQFQEKLHSTIGRNRRKVAIGIHDYDKLPSKAIYYKVVDINTVWEPLDYEGESTIKEILEEHEKGKEYGKLALSDGKHPALVSGDEIIAIPPVLNSNITKLEPNKTKNLFIDVTGTDERAVLKTLDVIVTTLAEGGGLIESVRVNGKTTPVLEHGAIETEVERIERLLGFKADIRDCLERMLYGVEIDNGKVHAVYPPFRVDIMDWTDLAEDVAIAYGYENVELGAVATYKYGELMDKTMLGRQLRKILVGHSFVELKTMILSSPKIHEILGLSVEAIVKNPIGHEYSVVRSSLLVPLLQAAKENQHRVPLRIFEIGKVYDGEERDEVGLLIMDREVGYEDVQAVVYNVMRILGLRPEARKASHPSLIEGRTAKVLVGGLEVGIMGEVKPETLERLEIRYPASVALLDVNSLLRALK